MFPYKLNFFIVWYRSYFLFIETAMKMFIWAVTWEKGSVGLLWTVQTRWDNAALLSDQGLLCLLTESLDTVEYIDVIVNALIRMCTNSKDPFLMAQLTYFLRLPSKCRYKSRSMTKPTMICVTSKDSDQLVYPPNIPKVLVYPFFW